MDCSTPNKISLNEKRKFYPMPSQRIKNKNEADKIEDLTDKGQYWVRVRN